MPPSYVANPFAAPGGPASQQAAQSNALRTYKPNEFAGSNPQRVTSMAPHLSVPEASRPYASDIALLRQGGYGDKMPNLDQMWRYSPHTYQTQVAELLRQPGVGGVLENLKNPPPPDLSGGSDQQQVVLPRDPTTGQVIEPTTQYNPATGERTREYEEWLRLQRQESGGD